MAIGELSMTLPTKTACPSTASRDPASCASPTPMISPTIGSTRSPSRKARRRSRQRLVRSASPASATVRPKIAGREGYQYLLAILADTSHPGHPDNQAGQGKASPRMKMSEPSIELTSPSDRTAFDACIATNGTDLAWRSQHLELSCGRLREEQPACRIERSIGDAARTFQSRHGLASAGEGPRARRPCLWRATNDSRGLSCCSSSPFSSPGRY